MLKLISKNKNLLTVATVGILLVATVFPKGVAAASITDASATLTRLEVSTSTSVDIHFTMPSGEAVNGDEILSIDFDEDGSQWTIDGASVTTSDVGVEVEKSASMTAMTITEVSTDGTLDCAAAAGTTDNEVQVDVDDTTGIVQVMFCDESGTWTDGDAAGEVDVEIGTAAGGTNRITNPSTANSYEIALDHNSGEGTAEVEVPIIDDDTVYVEGYIDTTLTFDIDTSETDEDCDASSGATPCDSHGGSTDDAGYVVDLGELTTTSVNKSGDTVFHADGVSGEINSIYFDLSTNADGGAVVTVLSANGALSGPGANEIPSVTNTGTGVAITAGDGNYGLREVTNSTTSGTITVSGDYDGASGTYGEATTTATTIFGTDSNPIDTGRIEFEVGATPDTEDGTGTYTDNLTFVATSTF